MSFPPAETTAASEDALVARAQAGDADAYAGLIARHQSMIHALAFRLTGSAPDAADLAQETFVRAWRQLASFRGESTLATWLRRIAVNAGLNWRRAAASRQQVQAGWSEHQRLLAEPEDAGRIGRVNDALQRLDPPVRAAVVLTVYEGLNHAEAAQVLGCAETTVSWRVWVARRQLKKSLADLAPKKGARP